MAATLKAHQLVGEKAHSGLFGGNILADRGDLTGQGSYEQAVEALNVTDLRYPGGSLTEYTFDIRNPDASTVIDERTGAEKSFIPISDFMSYAESSGHSVTIVVPTRTSMSSNADANGNRFADIDEEGLREYVHDLASGVYGNAKISGIEIGNEYWGSGEMTATEYGRVASEMGKIIKDELNLVDEIYGEGAGEIDVVFQMGHNYSYSSFSDEYSGWKSHDVMEDLQQRYPDADIDERFFASSGYINFPGINNELLKAEFDTEEIEAVDGITAHVYSRGEANTGSRTWDLRLIDSHWLNDEEFADLKLYVTEWNQKSTSGLDAQTDYGLFQAHEMLNVVEEFMDYGVDVAHVWPLIQNTKNPLSSGMEFEEPAVPGEMFAMMSETLTGKTMVDFATSSRETEFDGGNFDVHGFAGDNDLVLYIASTSRFHDVVADVDISKLVKNFSEIETTKLGVQPGEAPGDQRALPEVRQIDEDSIYEDGTLGAVLEPGEILQIVIKDVVPTKDFSNVFGIANGIIDPDPIVDETPIEEIPDSEEDPTIPDIPDKELDEGNGSEDDDEKDSGVDILESLGWASLIALPFMSLFTFA